MPRIFDSSNSPLDFCNKCFPTEEESDELYGQIEVTGEGPDGRGNCYAYEAEHPPYSDWDYECERCGKLLKDKDN